MTNYIRSFPILLVLALLISACKTANKLAREEKSAQAADSSHFSESFQSSLQNLFSSLYFQADSLVMWMQPCPAEDLYTPDIATQVLLPGSTSPIGSTAHPSSSHQHQAYKNPHVGKILIRGLKVSRVQTEGLNPLRLPATPSQPESLITPIFRRKKSQSLLTNTTYLFYFHSCWWHS